MIHRGVITRTDGSAVWVSVPEFGGEHGPLQWLRMPGRDAEGRPVTPTAPAAGDRVLVAAVADNPDDLIVVGAHQ